jgi:hypothetical protein
MATAKKSLNGCRHGAPAASCVLIVKVLMQAFNEEIVTASVWPELIDGF